MIRDAQWLLVRLAWLTDGPRLGAVCPVYAKKARKLLRRRLRRMGVRYD